SGVIRLAWPALQRSASGFSSATAFLHPRKPHFSQHFLSFETASYGLTQHRSQFGFPFPRGFMGKKDPAVQEHFRQIPATEVVADAPEHDEANHIGWVL